MRCHAPNKRFHRLRQVKRDTDIYPTQKLNTQNPKPCREPQLPLVVALMSCFRPLSKAVGVSGKSSTLYASQVLAPVMEHAENGKMLSKHSWTDADLRLQKSQVLEMCVGAEGFRSFWSSMLSAETWSDALFGGVAPNEPQTSPMPSAFRSMDRQALQTHVFKNPKP